MQRCSKRFIRNLDRRKAIAGAEIYLSVQLSAPDAVCKFSYSEDGVNFIPIGIAFKAQPDKWIGAKVGLFCISKPDVRTGGYADFDWFRIDK